MEAKRKTQVQESIAAHRRRVICEKEEKEREERQRALEERKAQMAEHQLFLEHQISRARENREKHAQLIRENERMAAEKRARLEQQRQEERDAALRKGRGGTRRDEENSSNMLLGNRYGAHRDASQAPWQDNPEAHPQSSAGAPPTPYSRS
ncbi:hypothetical protein GBF38_000439 [Nibea albiflora]|nr:hypothetical protein GBF38_000439 [Nibea albiflora]